MKFKHKLQKEKKINYLNKPSAHRPPIICVHFLIETYCSSNPFISKNNNLYKKFSVNCENKIYELHSIFFFYLENL